jgi:hypothetical protein
VEAGATLAMVMGVMLAIGGVVTGSAGWVAGATAAAVGGWMVRRRVTVRRERGDVRSSRET